MTFTEFVERLLVVLYQENQQTHDLVSFKNLVSKYGLETRSGWILEAKDDLQSRGYVTGPKHLGVDETALGKISGKGMRYVEDRYGDKDGVGTVIEPVEKPDSADPESPSNLADVSIHSSAWTGLPSGFRLTEESRTSLVTNLDRAESGLTALTLGQGDRAQVRAYIVAARALAEAPEPQADLIWELIGRANAIAGVASLFVSILALFVH